MLNYIKFATELCEVTESIFILKGPHLLFCHLFKNIFLIILSLADKIRGDRLQPLKFLASKFIPEKKLKLCSDPILSVSYVTESQSRNVGYFINPLIRK